MANFEEKLIALSDAETLKKAKALLKQKVLAGAWRNREGKLCGIFRETQLPAVETAVQTGEHTTAECSCRRKNGLCAHALALLMYGARFHTFTETAETPPVYSKGLLMQSFPELSRRGMKKCAKLRINVVEDQLHAPNQYKILRLSARLFGSSREYAGNLNNLRQLYFEKVLSAVLKYEDFSLHDQQIIRFLALNGEAENSNITLGAELTAELFHALPGFPRFFRDGRNIIVRPERAEAVLVKHQGKLHPGIRIGDTAMPMNGARLIAGRGGSWVGKDDEYFFIGGDCEAGFLRSFFRMSPQNTADFHEEFPLPVCNSGFIDPTPRKAVVMLDGIFADGIFELKSSYLYETGGKTVICAPHSGKIAANGRDIFRRDTEKERNFENSLALFGMDVADNAACAVITDTEKAGIFLDKALPEIIASAPEDFALSGRFSQLTRGGCGLPQLDFRCFDAGKSSDARIIRFQLGTPGKSVDWTYLHDAACSRSNYLSAHGRLWKISAELGRFMRMSDAILRNIDPHGCTFEVPFGNFNCFCTSAGKIPGALPPELLMDTAETTLPAIRSTFAFKGTLRNYQKDGVSFMQYLVDRSFNPLLADEMGLGKTVQLLALLSSRMNKNGSPSLIVCPASLIVNWAREAARFVPEFRVAAPCGTAERDAVLKAGEFDLLILSYTAAKLCTNALKKYHFEFLVLDEAQHIKNPGSTNAKNCKSIAASHRVVLTGTPLENTPEDLWSVMDFLQPGLFGSLPSFRRRYANIAADMELQEEFTARISPFIKRRTKSEVAADLPEKHEHIIYCDMPPVQRELYSGLLEENRDTLKNGGSAELFALLLRLRQCCCHPALLPDSIGKEVLSGKTELLFELLHETIDSGHKVLIFSQFTSMLQILIPALNAEKIPFEYLDGSTRNRQERVDRFNNDPDIPLFLLSLKAGGTGLNLTAADTVIIYDPWWNPAVELQAADRTHRIGQTRTVNTIKLVMKESVEEKVLLLQQKKRELFEKLVENPSASGGLSLAELRALME